MGIEDVIGIAATIAILATAVVYGTDVFCAVVLKPALAEVDDSTLVAVTGAVHRYGDRRMPVAGVLGIAGAAVSAGLGAVAGVWAQVSAAGVGLVLLAVWLGVYLRVSAPINRTLTAAADTREGLPNSRALQAKWDSVIGLRAVLQGLAVVAFCVVLAI